MRVKGIRFSSVCEIGLVRDNNQDSIYTDVIGKSGIFCVADGMGGYEKGEVASGLIVENVEKAWNDFFDNSDDRSFRVLFNTIGKAVGRANREIYEKYNQSSVCGSTVSILIIYEKEVGWLSAGDSRIYELRKEGLRRITADDLWENQDQQKGIPFEELRRSPKFGKLTNVIGVYRNVNLHHSIGKLNKRRAFFICSDGLYKMCSHDELERVIREHASSPQVVIDVLREKVIMYGAKDNFSGIMVYIDKKWI